MTPAYGLPILLDPRLNNVTTKFGLSPSKKAEYDILIHNLHYEWYTRAHLVQIHEQRIAHEADLRVVAMEEEMLARELREDDPLTPDADDDMGRDNPVAAPNTAKRLVDPPPLPPTIPLISAQDYMVISKQQYEAYVEACRNVVPWRVLYPNEELCVGEKLSHVNLAPVWNVCPSEQNKDCRFGYMLELAKHGKANVYKLQASSFVERVNSAGKTVLNDTNIKLNEKKVEKRVMLRMNRKWMCLMKATYDIKENLMCLLRASHDAVACQQGYNAYTTSRILPLHTSIDNAPPHSPDHVESVRGLVRALWCLAVRVRYLQSDPL
jgi:hypothetical protein